MLSVLETPNHAKLSRSGFWTGQVSAWPWLTLQSIILLGPVWPTVKLVVSSWSYHKTLWWNTKNPLRFALPFSSCFKPFLQTLVTSIEWLCNCDFFCVPHDLRTKFLPSNIFENPIMKKQRKPLKRVQCKIKRILQIWYKSVWYHYYTNYNNNSNTLHVTVNKIAGAWVS